MSVWKSDEKPCLRSNWYQAFDTVFHHQMKHLEVRQKNSAARRIFNSPLMLDISRATLLDILTSNDFYTQEDLASFREEDVFRPWILNPNTPQQRGRDKSTLYGPVAYTGGGGGGVRPPKRGTFFRVQVDERVGESVISICKKPKRANWCI